MRSSKIWRKIWIFGIYALLILILYLVILYKVKWENKDLNTYLYIYDCSYDLCSSTTKQNEYYSRVLCEEDLCPHIVDIINNNLILSRDNISWIYNYIENKTINNMYKNYRYIGDNMFVVTDTNDKQGVINLNGDILVNPSYEYIDNYKNNLVSYVVDELYGVNGEEEKFNISPQYQKLILINDKIFAGMNNNIYHLYYYDDIKEETDNQYNFIYSYDDVILVINNKKIDILDTNLNSVLVMKINTFYEYTTEKERSTLNIRSDETKIYFRVFTDEFKYIDYEYDVVNKKIK